MFIKLSLICMFVSSIIARVICGTDDVEKPLVRVTRGGKFYGWRTEIQHQKISTIKAANRRWRGEFSLTLGRLPLVATAVEFHHIQNPLYTKVQPCLESVNKISQPPQGNINSDTSYDPVSGIEDGMSTENPLMTYSSTPSTTAVTKESSTLKLEDYDEITFDPTLKSHDDNNNSSDGDLNAVNRVRRESENDNEIELTTVDVVESSTAVMHMTSSQDAMSSSNHIITTISSMLQVPHSKPPQHFHNDNTKFPHYYQPSVNPNAQYISITETMPPKLKNYFDFYPSQPDFYYNRNYVSNFVPWCSNTASHPMTYNYFRNF